MGKLIQSRMLGIRNACHEGKEVAHLVSGCELAKTRGAGFENAFPRRDAQENNGTCRRFDLPGLEDGGCHC